MDIKPYDKTIRDLFGSRRQFLIPRFQREYSWDKKNYEEFLVDMLDNLIITEGKIASSQYFLGTMLFIGNFTESTDKTIDVVDGQQRLTTITILFSALSTVFKELNEIELSEQVFKYIMTKDDDGKSVRILQSKTHYPYFSYFIQDIDKKVKDEPKSEEEICIKNTYEFFYSKLSENNLKSILAKRYEKKILKGISRIDILKALRDQVLNTTFVSISTTDQNQANKIFEILNAKGKKLAHIDLIKNKIFEILNETEPADFADDRWKSLKSILYAGKESVGLATFYRHFWISKYSKVAEGKLYDEFSKKISKNGFDCRGFLNELVQNAKYYTQILNPNRMDYDNRKEYFELVQSLNVIINYFNIVQVRVALLALYDAKERKIIDLKNLKKAISFLENFHFAYNAIFSGRSNKFEKIYSSFAIELRKATTKSQANDVITNKLIMPLEKIYPSWSDFSIGFKKLEYSKQDIPSNVKCKYAINKLNTLYSQKLIFEDDGSIEHILPEDDKETFNIGNLILLEESINGFAKDKDYVQKKILYANSNYAWVKDFLSKNPDWDKSKIESRAEELAKLYYTNVLGREIK